MSLLRRIIAGGRALLRPGQAEADLDEELRAYLEASIDEKVRAGTAPEQAMRAARVEIGSLEAVKDHTRDAGWEARLDGLWRDLRHAARALRKAPAFVGVAVVTLACGIGLNAAMFSVLNTFLLRPLPYPQPEQLFALVRTTATQQDLGHKGVNYPAIAQESEPVAELAAYLNWGVTISEPGHPAEFRHALRVSARFLDVLRVRPAIGRGFRPEEDAPGRHHVIILSDGYWRSRFDADPQVIGRVVRVDGERAEIVGVLPASASAPGVIGPAYMLRPLAIQGDERTFATETLLSVVGRYRPNVAAREAQARFDTVAARLNTDYPNENAGMGLRIVSIHNTMLSRDAVPVIYLLVGLSGFVLLIACANLANLLVARTLTRSRELAVRAALGASRAQLIRQLSAECLLFGAAGAGLGVCLSLWTIGWLAHRLSGDGPMLTFAHDWRVLGFALCAALTTVCVFSVGLGWLIARMRVNESLKAGVRGATADPSHRRLRHALIAAQLALALVLLTGAAVFVRGLDRLLTRDPGWNPEPLVTAKISLPPQVTRDPDRTLQFHRTLRDRLAALPGAENASVDIALPLFGFPGPREYVVEGPALSEPRHEPIALTNAVSPEYFDTIGLPIVRGRGILPADTRESPPVVVINDSMARALFAEGEAVGRRISRAGTSEPEWAEIVGVARDVRLLSLSAPPTSFQVYKPLAQETWGYVRVTVRARSAASTAALVEPVRRVIAELDPDLPALDLMPVPALIVRLNSDMATINRCWSVSLRWACSWRHWACTASSHGSWRSARSRVASAWRSAEASGTSSPARSARAFASRRWDPGSA